VHPITRADLGEQEVEDSATVAARVASARDAQRTRLAATPWSVNAEVKGPYLRHGPLRLPRRTTRTLDEAMDRHALTLRGYDRCLRVAWTVADLAGRDQPDAGDTEFALTLRTESGVAA
jgi:magnesium chelatase family protein